MDTEPALQQQSAAPGLFAQLCLYWQQLRHESLLQLQLFTLEAQLAAESLAAIWLLALWAGLMLVGAWLLLQLLIGQGLQAMGLASWQSLLLLFLLQPMVLLVCLRQARYRSRFCVLPKLNKSVAKRRQHGLRIHNIFKASRLHSSATALDICCCLHRALTV